MFELIENEGSHLHEYGADIPYLRSKPPVIGEDALTTESLTSYICRLSEAHRVLPATLIAGVTAKQEAPLDMTSLKNASAAMNGVGVLSARWVKIMEEMTGRPDIAKTTFQHLSGTISSRYLLRPRRAWCGLCLADFAKASGSIVYEPLIWLVKDYNACIVHRTLLLLTCPGCGRGSFPLEGHSRSGHCAKCGLFLGSPSVAAPASERDLSFSSTVNTVLTLLAGSENQQQEVLRILNAAFSATNAKTYEELSVLSGVPSETLRAWHHKSTKASLRDIAKLVDVFSLDIGNLSVTKAETPQPGKGCKPVKAPRRDLSIQDLLIYVKENPKIMYIEEVCKAFKVGKSFVYDRFRDQSSELIEMLQERQEKNRDRADLKIHRVLTSSKTKIPPPSLHEVANRCGCHISNLYRNYKEDCKEISKRHAEYTKMQTIEAQVRRHESLKSTIAEMAADGVYPSMRALKATSPGGIKEWQISRDRQEIFSEVGIRTREFKK